MKKTLSMILAAALACLSLTALAFDARRTITVFSREDGSGTRGAFVELLGIETTDEAGAKLDLTTDEAIITNATSVMLGGVAGDPYAIGYVSLGSMNASVKALAVDGVEATTDAIKDGSYKVSRPFNIAAGASASDAAKDFIAYILSAEGQAVIEANGYIAAVEGAAPYAGSASGKIVVAGSSSITPVMEKLKEAYLALNTGASIEIQESDSTTGMQSTLSGICDIGMASRALKDSELAGGLTPTVIALDGIAVIVHPDNPAGGLTGEDIRAVFAGEITEWDSLIKEG